MFQTDPLTRMYIHHLVMCPYKIVEIAEFTGQ